RRERGLELGPDAVGAAHQDRLLVAGRDPGQRGKAADPTEHLGPHRRLRERLDPIDQGVAGVDVDPRVLVGERHLGLVYHTGPGVCSGRWSSTSSFRLAITLPRYPP